MISQSSSYFMKCSTTEPSVPTTQLSVKLKEMPNFVAQLISGICRDGKCMNKGHVRPLILGSTLRKCIGFFFMFVSFSFIAHGGHCLIKASATKDVLGDPILYPKGITFLVVGHTFLVPAAVEFYLAWKFCSYILLVYFLWLVAQTLGLLFIGSVLVHKTSEIMQMTSEYIDGKIINEYKSDPAVQEMIDHLQKKNKCCGGSNFRVYEDVWRSVEENGASARLPLSCCSVSNCIATDSVPDLKGVFNQGCFSTLENAVKQEINSLSVPLLIFGILTFSLGALVFWELNVTRPASPVPDAAEYLDCEEKFFSLPPDVRIDFGDLADAEQGDENSSQSGVC